MINKKYNIYISTSYKKPITSYFVVIKYEKKIVKTLSNERSNCTLIKMVMRGIVDVIKEFNNSNSEITIYCNQEHIVNAFNKGWLNKWIADDFKVKKGKKRPNWKLWIVIKNLIDTSKNLETNFKHIKSKLLKEIIYQSKSSHLTSA